MHSKLFCMAPLAIMFVLLLAPPDSAHSQQSPSTATDEAAVRALISKWVEAYRNLDAKKLAALELPNVQTIDRFGDPHLPAGRNENEKLWSETFENISPSFTPPHVNIEHIGFLGPDVAVVQASWQFVDGILLVGGDRIAPYSEIDTFVVTKTDKTWLCALHIMQEKKP